MSAADTIHATCVARGDHAVLLTGPSGIGKSDLALRLIDRGWDLVSDDYTIVTEIDGILRATPPLTIAGLIEVRGVGIITMPHRGDVPVALLCHLVDAVDRLPESRFGTIAGLPVPWAAIVAREPSAPIKLEQALRKAIAS